MDNLPTTRAEAKKTGSKYYFTGQPCKHGHIAPRKTKGACVECLKAEWAADNERRKGEPKTEAAKAAGRRYYERNKEAVVARAQSRTVESKNAYKKKHKVENPDYYKSLVNARRRRFRDATPKWLTAEHKMEIRLKYRLAIELSRKLGVPYAVDHTIPLQGEDVCGLHVPWNMEVITQEQNLKKSNKLVDTP
jgi:5-methylcytosine-specific restriction endonuclease McrA